MLPTLYQVPNSPLGVHTYGLMILLAFVAAFALIHGRAREIGLYPEQLVPVYAAAAVFGLLGGRVTYALVVA
jgi:prolipoprotein diacylglyceryltransferase